MRPEPSIHDNLIYAYSVDCEGRRLVLHTTYREGEPHEFTDIIFHDVVAHHFEHVLPGNILFGLEEVEVESFVADNDALFADSWRHGWPPINYNGDLNVLIQALKTQLLHAYWISSSFGLSGWVLAGSSQCIRRSQEATIG